MHVHIERGNAVKFFTFDGMTEQLIDNAALDTEPAKPIPGICQACHGGRYNPQTRQLLGAKFLPFDVFSFGYSNAAGFSFADQSDAFRQLNALVRASARHPTSITAFIDGMYTAGVSNPASVADNGYIPAGWAGAETTYTFVVKPYCRMCHIAQDAPFDFMDKGSFMSLAAAIQGDVCTAHVMPHAEVPFKKLWQTTFPDAVAELKGFLNITSCP
ncbi:MAG TPA: hypothetical protein VKB36_19960 [Vicinamibacterales bacterium]|nr:hypothetical protein [Vicinamibacterales bacterium]